MREPAIKQDAPQPVEAPPVTVAMSVPSGTPIKVALDSEVRIRDGRTTDSRQDHGTRIRLRQAPHSRRHSGERKSVGHRCRPQEDPHPGSHGRRFFSGSRSPCAVRRIDPGRWTASPYAHRRVPVPRAECSRFVPASEKPGATNTVHEAASKKVSAMRQQIRQSGPTCKSRSTSPEKCTG